MLTLPQCSEMVLHMVGLLSMQVLCLASIIPLLCTYNTIVSSALHLFGEEQMSLMCQRMYALTSWVPHIKGLVGSYPSRDVRVTLARVSIVKRMIIL